jgi:hypothetical protein
VTSGDVTARAGSVRPARPGLLDRALSAIPLASIVIWLGALYVFESVWRRTPTLFSDEMKWTQLSRAISDTGRAAQRGAPASFGSLYSYLIAPAWWAGDTGSGYDLAKYISMLAMAAAAIPAYLLARRLVSKPAALFVAAASIAIPSMAYGLYLIPEPAAYPWATLCALLIVGALATASPRWIVAACAASLVAPLVRSQLVVVPAAFALAAFGLWWTGAGGRRLRRGWTATDTIGAVVLAAGAFLVVNRLFLHGLDSWSYTTEFRRGWIYDNLVWALGALTVGLGVLPLVGAIVALFPVRGEPRGPWERAFVAVLASYLVTFGVYTGVKAAFLQATFATRVTERNLFYLAPLFFAATALVLERRRVRLVPLGIALALTAYVLWKVPLQLDYPYFEAFGFSLLAWANRTLRFDVPMLHTTLYVTLAVSGAVLAATWALGRGLFVRGRVAVAAGYAVLGVALVAWNLGGELAAASASGDSSAQLARGLPDTLNWIDTDTQGQPATYLGQTLGNDGLGINLLEFWNRSIVNVWSLDGSAPGPGPTLSPDLASTDGTLANPPHTPFLVADHGVNPVGEPIDSWQTVRLYRLSGPIRLVDWVTGIEPDGWMKTDSSYTRFRAVGGGSQTAVVTLDRRGFCPDPAKHVPGGEATITSGSLAINWNHQPALGKVREVRHVAVRNCKLNPTRIDVGPAPWRVEVHVDGTFRPVDYGGSDARDLGAVVGYAPAPER